MRRLCVLSVKYVLQTKERVGAKKDAYQGPGEMATQVGMAQFGHKHKNGLNLETSRRT